MNCKRILVLATHCIGDSLLVTTLTRSLRRKYPDAQIDVLVTPRGRLIFELNSDVNQVIDFPQRPKPKDYFQFLRQFGRYDLVVNERVTDRTAIYCLLFGRFRLGVVDEHFGGAWFKKRIYNHHILERQNNEHKMSRMARMLDKIDVEIEPLLVAPQEALPKSVVEQLPSQYLVVHAPSSNEIKQWPVEHWQETLSLLLESGYHIVLTGAPSERDTNIVNSLVSYFPDQSRLVSLLGKLSLPQTATLIKQSLGFVGPDSGPGHLASGFPVPIISVISVAPASKWSPWPYEMPVDRSTNLYHNRIPVKQVHNNVAVLQSERDCVPCDGSKCRISDGIYSPCLTDITPKQVVETVKEMVPLGDESGE
ncbi:LPS biosynthesis protein [Vibrio astriarenae]|uniref:LPS biosynthesis protein n=1 Tax=Vibrio astriarenae TaxID=1481923 RepID=A0A7Z2YEI5_9VIBR|nr:glycosyltransferase family 9 protein [Vibrio astriarenae]QIA64472.1 LPS biosynthesis protein [Vibrio astriarenae]